MKWVNKKKKSEGQTYAETNEQTEQPIKDFHETILSKTIEVFPVAFKGMVGFSGKFTVFILKTFAFSA